MTKAGAVSVPHQAWNWATISREQLSEAVARQMVHGETLMICRLTFAPGTVTAAHEHVHEQMTIAEKGRVRFVLGADEKVFGPGDMLLFPSQFWHGAMMLDEEVVLIDVFSPIREDFLPAQAVGRSIQETANLSRLEEQAHQLPSPPRSQETASQSVRRLAIAGKER